MITLSNIFSREKTLFYFTMWNDSDRLGYERFLGHKVKNNLFIIPKAGEKGSVWYSLAELAEIETRLKNRINDLSFQSDIISTLDENWLKLTPFLIEGRLIENTKELSKYYEALVTWWSAMNTVFGVPDMSDAPQDFVKSILSRREVAEKYSERADAVFSSFWSRALPNEKQLVSRVLPEEALQFIDGKLNSEQVSVVRARVDGCFMHNRNVYPMVDLDAKLKENGVELEQVKVENQSVVEIKGRTAQVGKVKGPVKIVKVKADLAKITSGDVLVTEMTNPDYVSYMKIASAVVTDEGGATCHAAIASRELKIPCIVGTRVATIVLKDGDMVEVDADKGVVKIIT